jgi:transketolase
MTKLEQQSINTIRFLAVDAVQRANSGHPGLPMGAAPMASVLWKEFLKHNPLNPQWPDRDRFVLSGGHGSMLLYALLYLTGYNEMTMDQLKSFRQWGSITPGHPESNLTRGVEATTGPLGQGISNGVGMAIAERFLASTFNRKNFPIVDHYTYVLATDGDMMEGIASEASSIAGHLGLGKLIVLYDDNDISLAAPTRVSFTEDVTKRFESYGWQVLMVEKGNTELDEIRAALKKGVAEKKRPTLIRVKTTIGFGSPNKANTHDAHGSPLGEDEVKATKQNLGWPLSPSFYIPEDVLKEYREAVSAGKKGEASWNQMFQGYKKEHTQLAQEWEMIWAGELPKNWEKAIPVFSAEDGPLATRKASGSVINALVPVLKNFIGGSADLAPSTNTYMKGTDEQQRDIPSGRNIRFGVREHAMGAIVNGIAYHGGLIPYGATFLTFSDYMRGSVRLSALSHLHTIWIWTHDSVWLGEDGPTHQSVEHNAALRAIPNLTVIRPCDANETAEAWKLALQHDSGPVALILSRQGLPVLDRTVYGKAEGLALGAYVLSDSEGLPDVILVATGSEVELALQQSEDYRNSVLPPAIRARVVIEAGVSLGWHKYAGDRGRMVCRDDFGASAPLKVLREKFGFTPEHVMNEALKAVAAAKV